MGAGRAKWEQASREAAQLFGLADSWHDRLSIAEFLARRYLARALPLPRYGSDACLRLYGCHYTVGLETSEIYALEEVFNHRLYDRLADFVPRPNWVVFDVGAKAGIVSMLQAQRGAQVFAFEPNPDCYRRLLKNIHANGLSDRVRAFNLALGGPMTTLDRLLPNDASRIDLLQIDAQHAELEVLRSSRALSVTRRLILELRSVAQFRQTEEFLTESGFGCEAAIEHPSPRSASGQERAGIVYASRSRG